MNIRPLTGQVLVRMLPREYQTDKGLFLPDIAFEVQHGAGTKKQPFKAVVVALGPWKKTNQGFGVLPDFGIGQTVICTPYSGTPLTRDIGEHLQLVRFEDIIAKIETVLSC